jgi:hypothetical protein
MTDLNLLDRGADKARPAATGPDYEYFLTIEEVADRYAAAGHPRTLRTVQRYCAREHLDAQKVATAIGDKYLVAPYSVSRHIAQINEVIAFTTSRDMPRPSAAIVANESQHISTEHTSDTTGDTSRQDAAGRVVPDRAESDSRYVTQLEKENSFLRDQIAIKDTQISELGTRARETNVLIKGLQDLLLRLQPGRAPYEPSAPADREGV